MSLILRSSLFLLISLLMLSVSFGQDSASIKDWKVESKKIGDNQYELNFRATASQGWQLYEPNQVFDEVRMAELKFTDSSVTTDNKFTTDNEGKKVESPYFGPGVSVFEGPINWKVSITINGAIPKNLLGSLSYSLARNDEFITEVFEFQVGLEGGVEGGKNLKVASIDIYNPISPCGDEGTKHKSIFTIFLLGILGGIIALITPCVFPMIPVTVTFFTKKIWST